MRRPRLFVMPRKPRPLVASGIMRAPPRQTGGGRERESLVQLAHQSMRRGSKSFALASRLFDKSTRERAWLLYAWCRRCDDIADARPERLAMPASRRGQDHGGALKLDESTARNRIEAIRILTRRALDGQPTAEVAFDAIGQVATEAGLSADMTEDVIDGFALDAEGWRPRSEADLMRYCYHVAGAVGVMLARAMGVPADDHDTLDRACDLGLYFQLVNIARDVSEDDAAGRCYLPVEWLVEADIPPGEHMRPDFREQLVGLVARLLDMADEHKAAALFGAGRLPFRQRWAVIAAAEIYGAIARDVRLRGPAAWDHKPRTGYFAKLGLIAQAFFAAFKAAPQPDPMPRWTRGELMTMIRMAGPIAPMPTTPLPDEEM